MWQIYLKMLVIAHIFILYSRPNCLSDTSLLLLARISARVFVIALFWSNQILLGRPVTFKVFTANDLNISFSTRWNMSRVLLWHFSCRSSFRRFPGLWLVSCSWSCSLIGWYWVVRSSEVFTSIRILVMTVGCLGLYSVSLKITFCLVLFELSLYCFFASVGDCSQQQIIQKMFQIK